MVDQQSVMIPIKGNSHELHWRKEPPKWKGNIDAAYKKYYPHLIDEIYCRHCGAIPCPLDHEEEKSTRLTDLDFVVELVQSKKDMEARVAEVENQMKTLEYKHARWQEEKHDMMADIRTFQFLQKEWEGKKKTMQTEIGALNKIKDEHGKLVTASKLDQIKIQSLSNEVYKLSNERDDFESEAASLKKLVSSQVDKVNHLNEEVTEVTTELKQTKSTVKILKVQLEEVNDLKTTAQIQLDEKDTMIKDLELEIRKVIEDLLHKTKEFEEKELTSENMIDRLRQQISHLKVSVEEVVNERNDLKAEVERLLKEIESLQKQLKEGRRFHQFVEIKREVNQLKERNLFLFKNLPQETLPTMKPSGRIKSAGVKTSRKQPLRRLTRPKSSPHIRERTEPVQEYEKTVIADFISDDWSL